MRTLNNQYDCKPTAQQTVGSTRQSKGKMSSRRLAALLGAILACIAIMLVACTKDSHARYRVRLTIAGTPGTLVYVPHLVALSMGFYQRHGIDLTIVSVPGGTRAVLSLVGGSSDVILGYFDHPVRISAQGHVLRSFVMLSKYPGNVLLVSPLAKKRIESVEDLKGMKIGIPDPGSQAQFFLNHVLVRHRLSPDQIEVVPTGLQANAVAALERGRIDAWSGFDPGITEVLSRHPGLAVLADARSEQGVQRAFGSRIYPGAVLYSTAYWLQQNPKSARRLAHAIKEALGWMQTHSLEEIAARVPGEYKGSDPTLYSAILRKSLPMYSADGTMTMEGAEAVRTVLATTLEGVRNRHFDLAETFTNEFVKE